MASISVSPKGAVLVPINVPPNEVALDSIIVTEKGPASPFWHVFEEQLREEYVCDLKSAYRWEAILPRCREIMQCLNLYKPDLPSPCRPKSLLQQLDQDYTRPTRSCWPEPLLQQFGRGRGHRPERQLASPWGRTHEPILEANLCPDSQWGIKETVKSLGYNIHPPSRFCQLRYFVLFLSRLSLTWGKSQCRIVGD